MQLSRNERKYWKLVRFSDGAEAAIANDGLMYLFEKNYIWTKLTKYFPTRDKIGWFFNSSKDRYCAEFFGDERITVNPSAVFTMFGEYPIEV